MGNIPHAVLRMSDVISIEVPDLNTKNSWLKNIKFPQKQRGITKHIETWIGEENNVFNTLEEEKNTCT
jgi:hypothetical protein